MKQIPAQSDPCPWPGCALEAEHSGDHLPRLRLVQRYHWWTKDCASLYPGHCEWGECCDSSFFDWPAVAMYRTYDGKTLDVCRACEEALIEHGYTESGELQQLGGAA